MELGGLEEDEKLIRWILVNAAVSAMREREALEAELLSLGFWRRRRKRLLQSRAAEAARSERLAIEALGGKRKEL